MDAPLPQRAFVGRFAGPQPLHVNPTLTLAKNSLPLDDDVAVPRAPSGQTRPMPEQGLSAFRGQAPLTAMAAQSPHTISRFFRRGSTDTSTLQGKPRTTSAIPLQDIWILKALKSIPRYASYHCGRAGPSSCSANAKYVSFDCSPTFR